MPNPSVSFRVQPKELTAWQQVVALLRKLSPEEAERRLQGASGADVKASGHRRDGKVEGVQYLESRLLAALGRWKLPTSQKARALLSRNGLPDTAENRCSAMVAAAEEETEQRRRELNDLLRQERELCKAIKSLSTTEAEARRRLHAIKMENWGLEAARDEAREDYKGECERELERLHRKGYASDDIRAVIDTARKILPTSPGAVAMLLGAAKAVDGKLQICTSLQDKADTLERYVGLLKEEAEELEMQLPPERIEVARAYTRIGMEPNDPVHRSGNELARVLASFGGKMPAPDPVGGRRLPHPDDHRR